jgi:hypothetical protein
MATGGMIDGLDWTDYSIPVPRQWTASSPAPLYGEDMPAPLIPYHSTQYPAWNSAVDAAWAAQNKFGSDWNTLMLSAAHPTGDKFLGMVHDTYEEEKYWDTIAQHSLPATLKTADYGPVIANETSVASLLSQAGYGALSSDVTAVKTRVSGLASLWDQFWGAGQGTTPGTVTPVPLPLGPGPQGEITLNGAPSFNLEPFATLGGPAAGFTPAGAGSMGFGSGGGVLFDAGGGPVPYAAGGEVESISMPTLADIAGQFGILVPGQNGFVPLPVAALTGQRMAAAHTQAAPPRSLSEAGAVSSRIGVNISGDLVVNNPRPERPSDSITRSTQRLAVLAGRGA